MSPKDFQEVRIDLGLRLRERRIELGWKEDRSRVTQTEMVDRTGIRQSLISDIELGKDCNLSIDQVIAVARGYRLAGKLRDDWFSYHFGMTENEFSTDSREERSEDDEADWVLARQIIQQWVEAHQWTKERLARESGIPFSIVVKFLHEEATLEKEYIVKLYNVVCKNMCLVDRRTLLKALGLAPLLGTPLSKVSVGSDTGGRLTEIATASTEVIAIPFDYFVNQFEDSLNLIRRMMHGGDPQKAQRLAETTDVALVDILCMTRNPVNRKKLLKIRGQLLAEKARICSAIALPYRDTLLLPIKSLAKEIRDIARECDNDQALLAISDTFLADAHYILGEHAQSLQLATRALESTQDSDDRLYILRLLGLGLSHLGKMEAFDKANAEAREIIDEGQFANWMIACQTLEGLGRSLVSMKGPKASFDYLNECKNMAIEHGNRGERALLVRTQLARSGLRVLKQLQTTDSEWLAEARTYLSMAEVLPFPRHAEQLKQLVDSS